MAYAQPEAFCCRVSGYIRTALQWEIHAELAEWLIRSLIVELPEPEIYYPPGVELTLTLNRPLFLDPPLNPDQQLGRQLPENERAHLAQLVATMPHRTRSPISGRSSDLTNVLFIGSQDKIVNAFDAARWS